MKTGQFKSRPIRLIVYPALILTSLITVTFFSSYIIKKEAPFAPPDQPEISASGPRLRFEENAGQTDPQVAFLCRGRNHILYLTSTGSVMHLNGDDENLNNLTLQMEIVGGSPDTKGKGLNRLVSKSNYFRGNDPGSWITGVPHFDRVGFEDVYSGIDLVYYIHDDEVEFDFLVKPGALPEMIRMDFSGIEKMKISRNGDLILHAGGHRIVYRKPFAWQTIDGNSHNVDVEFILADNDNIGFKLGKYDANETLIIDPQVVYATYLGGSDYDYGYGIAVDPEGHAYVTGKTGSADFPILFAYQSERKESFYINNWDVFVTKFNKQGTDIIYSTYIGGTNSDIGEAIAVDGSGCVYLTGFTKSKDNRFTPDINEAYPMKNALPQIDTTTQNGHAFVTVLNASGSELIYSTVFGGTGSEYANDIAIDNSGYAYITGYTMSSDLPVINAYKETLSSTKDAFMAKFDPFASGESSLLTSTYLGGSDDDEGIVITVDKNGCVFVAGNTKSSDFHTTQNVLQTEQKGDGDIFITKFSTNPKNLEYSTYIGSSEIDLVSDMDVDTNGCVYISGGGGDDFTITPGAFMKSGLYPFVCKLKSDASDFVYSTNVFAASAITVNDKGQAYVAGGWSGASVFLMNTSGTDTVFSVNLEGGNIQVLDVALYNDDNIYITGYTASTNVSVKNAYQSSFGGKTDVIVAKFGIPDIPENEFIVEVLQDSLGHDAMPIPNTSFDIYTVDLANVTEPYAYFESRATDDQGLLHLPAEYYFPGMPVLIRYHAETRSALKNNRNGESTIMYEVYVDNLIVSNNGKIEAPCLETDPGDTTRTYLGHTSLAYNLVVSIEWLASADYVAGLMDAFIYVSNLLYDITNGQAYINHVTIFDNKEYWLDADIRFYVNNTQWPEANVNGIETASDVGFVHLPPVMYRNKPNPNIEAIYESEPLQPAARNNISTIVHELGHYLFGFYDEYQQGKQANHAYIFKTVNFGFMDHPDNPNNPASSEMSDYVTGDYEFGTYSLTEHYDIYKKNCWDRFTGSYSKMYGPVRAQIHTPKDIGISSDKVIAGPNSDLENPDFSVGDIMDFDINVTMTDIPRRVYLLTFPNSDRPAPNAIVKMYKKSARKELNHGKTTRTGHIRLFNAEPGDVINFVLNENEQWKFREILAGPSEKNSANLAETVELKSVTGRFSLLSGIAFDALGKPVYQCISEPVYTAPPVIRVYEKDTVSEDQTLSLLDGLYSTVLNNPDFTEGSVYFSAPDSIGEHFFIPQSATVINVTDTIDTYYLSGMQIKIVFSLPETTAERMSLLTSDFPGPSNGLPDSVRRVSKIICMNTFPADSETEVSLQIRYDVDTLEAAVPEAMTVYKWEDSWIPLVTGVDLEHQTVTATLDGHGYYAVFLDLTKSRMATHDNNAFEMPGQSYCRLYPNYPNPFSSFTTIGFELTAGSQVNISIYDIQGKKVRTLIDETMTA
ncbi:MAG: SBBP repeat-containing protein, partial [Bacteroidales bacterium]|nr:SBBP repeat-containing protein [Bacteroidales bacterium]